MTTAYQRDSAGLAIGPDPSNRVLRGVIVAESGNFRTANRGRFDATSLREITRLMREDRFGTPSYFTHGADRDGLGYFLGRLKSPRLDGDRVRADLHFDTSAYLPSPLTGGTPLAVYALSLAASDPQQMAGSLVLQSDKIVERDRLGRAMVDSTGKVLPPIWRPSKILSCDLVALGDSSRSLLGFDPSAGEARPLSIVASRDGRRVDIEVMRARWRHKQRLIGVELLYSDDQPRDDQGRWSDGGGAGTARPSQWYTRGDTGTADRIITDPRVQAAVITAGVIAAAKLLGIVATALASSPATAAIIAVGAPIGLDANEPKKIDLKDLHDTILAALIGADSPDDALQALLEAISGIGMPDDQLDSIKPALQVAINEYFSGLAHLNRAPAPALAATPDVQLSRARWRHKQRLADVAQESGADQLLSLRARNRARTLEMERRRT